LFLLALVVVELLLAAGLYKTTQQAASTGSGVQPSVVPPVGTATRHHGQTANLPLVQNWPRTVVVGNKELFSVRLPHLPNTSVTYTLVFPNEPPHTQVMKTDASGFSKVIFDITHQPAQYREPVVISVYYHGVQEATTRFAVQLPVKP
jgi:hypothetical protein